MTSFAAHMEVHSQVAMGTTLMLQTEERPNAVRMEMVPMVPLLGKPMELWAAVSMGDLPTASKLQVVSAHVFHET